jgi:hypothetical protein
LAPETMTHDKATLSWNLAFGYMLSYDLTMGHFEAPAWREVVAVFQSHVASRYAGEKMIDYVTVEAGVTQSTFESVTVVTNWNEATSYTLGSHTIPPQGTLVTSKDGSLTAGIFTTYNAASLSFGDHYLVVERSAQMDSIRIWQPLGDDTPLAIERPAAWRDSIGIHVYAVGQDTFIEVTKSVTKETITFDWNHFVAGVEILYYVLTSDVVGAVGETPSATPREFQLFQNYPNPFNAATKIAFALPHASRVKLEVFNLVGQRVATLADGHFNRGYHFVRFDASGLPSGVYIYRIETGRFGQSRKLIALK